MGTILRGLTAALLLGLTACSETENPNTPPADIRPSSALSDSRPAGPRGVPENAPLPAAIPPGPKPRDARATDWFEDVTGQTRIHFAYRTGAEAGLYELLESVGGGVALLDFDQDGDLDIFLTGGGRFVGEPTRIDGYPSALYRNEGSMTFPDATRESGLGDETLYTHGAAVGDFDRDGWPDLLVAGLGGVRLFRNRAGAGFEDVTSRSGIVSPGWNTAAAWTDLNADGWLDLFVMTYAKWSPDPRRRCINDAGLRDVCAPVDFPAEKDRVFLNQKDGTFEDVTDRAGPIAEGRGLGVVSADFNDDGHMDVFVANDVNENQLYLGPLPFREEGILSGVALSTDGQREGSMGVDVLDVDRDGKLDLFYLNYATEDNSLRRNVGDGGFVDVTNSYGLTGISRPWVKFGCSFTDFDGDGWEDLVITNGHVAYGRRDCPYLQPAQLLASEGGKRFRDASDEAAPYFTTTHAGRGLAVGDLDNDGAPDLVISHQNDPVIVLRNRRTPPAWVRVRLVGTASNTEAIGAKLTLGRDENRVVRWIVGGGGYLSQNDRRVLFALKSAEPQTISVVWPGGKKERFDGLTTGKTHDLVEGRGHAE